MKFQISNQPRVSPKQWTRVHLKNPNNSKNMSNTDLLNFTSVTQKSCHSEQLINQSQIKRSQRESQVATGARSTTSRVGVMPGRPCDALAELQKLQTDPATADMHCAWVLSSFLITKTLNVYIKKSPPLSNNTHTAPTRYCGRKKLQENNIYSRYAIANYVLHIVTTNWHTIQVLNDS